jgi:nucleoside-diphosphate-sugar epimerase
MLIFISSTGVYGNCEGGWIDEDTPCHPDRESGRMALAAEETLRSSALGACATVLRLAGLYGPGRIPKIDDLLAGGPLAVAAGAVVNLIHVDDAASVVLAAERQARPSATYVVSDGHPVPRREFYRYLAELLRLPPPTFVEPSPREGRSPRGAGNKRVRNHRMLEELHVRLDYPSYREGLAAIA